MVVAQRRPLGDRILFWAPPLLKVLRLLPVLPVLLVLPPFVLPLLLVLLMFELLLLFVPLIALVGSRQDLHAQ